MNTILGELGRSEKMIDIIKQTEKTKSLIGISGLTGVGETQLISSLNEYSKKPIMIITYNEIQAKQIVEDLKVFTNKTIFFPKKEIVTYDYVAESKDLPYERIEALSKIKEKRNPIIVTTIEAIMQKLPSKQTLFKNALKLKVGEIHNLEERGQFSIRGGILDISMNENTGYRVEFWGDEIDSIRIFNITSQRSVNTLEKIEIYPAHEYILEKGIEEICNKIQNLEVTKEQEEIIQEDIEQIKAGNYISKIDKYFECFYEEQETLLDYISENYIIAIDEFSKLEQRAKNIKQEQ